ncbi:hypothetical protein SLS61_002513 [Didymella pomorum]
MCLVKVKQEEDVVVPYRVVSRHNHSPPRRRASRHSTTRYSREVVRESHQSPRPSASYVAVPTPQPKPLAIPPPQPVPVFVEPPPAPIHVPAPPPPASHISSRHSHHGAPQYVEVSPRSSYSSRSSSPNRSEYVYREREDSARNGNCGKNVFLAVPRSSTYLHFGCVGQHAVTEGLQAFGRQLNGQAVGRAAIFTATACYK